MSGYERSPDSTSAGEAQWSDIFVLAEFNSLEDLNNPIKATNRIQYTCFDISKRFIAFGANTGGIYIFHRESLKYLQLIANQDGHILLIAFAPDDNVFAFATSKGMVTVLEHNSEHGKSKPNKVQVSPEHRHNQITALQWDCTTSRLFIGDDTGKVSLMNISLSKARSIFTFPYEILMKLDSRVVQLDYAEKKLLVSTITKCYICFTDREKYLQVGRKPRDGDFGSCFYYNSKHQSPVIYSARPGSRIWEADSNGEVLNTHQLKELLAVPPLPLVTYREDYKAQFENTKYPSRSLSFSKLLFVGDHFLAMWTDNDLFIFDPVNVNLVLWNNQTKDKMDIKCYKSVLYCLSHQGKVSKLSLMPLGRCVTQLYNKKMWKLCAQVCWYHQNTIITPRLRRYVPINMIENLKEILYENGLLQLADLMDILLNKLESDSGDPPSPISSGHSSVSSFDSYRLESGIVVVHPAPGTNSEEDFFGLDSEACTYGRTFIPIPSNFSTPNHSPQQSVKTSPGSRYTFIKNNSSPSIQSGLSSDLELEISPISQDIKHCPSTEEQKTNTLGPASEKHSISRKYSDLCLNKFDDLSTQLGRPKRFHSVQSLTLEPFASMASSESCTTSLGVLDSDADKPIVFCMKKEKKKTKKNQEGEGIEKQKSMSLTSIPAYFQSSLCESNREAETIPEIECSNAFSITEKESDYSRILDISLETKSKLENPQIFHHTNQLQEILERWVIHLHHATLLILGSSNFNCEDLGNKLESPGTNGITLPTVSPTLFHNSIFSSNPKKDFLTNEEIIRLHQCLRTQFCKYSSISELTTLCFEVGIFKISTFFNLLKNDWQLHLFQEKSVNNHHAVQESLTKPGRKSSSVCITLKLPHEISASDSPVIRSSHSPPFNSEQNLHVNSVPLSLGNNLSLSSIYFSPLLHGQSLDIDIEAAVFIKLYFPLLDIIRIKKAISYQDGKRYHRWSALIDCIIGGHSDLSALIHICREAQLHPEGVIDLLLYQEKNLTPLDSVYIIQRLNGLPSLLINFAYSLFSPHADSNSTRNAERLLKFCKDPEVVLIFIEALLGPNLETNKFKCECGMPRPGSHLLEWKHDMLLKSILNQKLTNKETLKQVFQKAGYWSGYITLCKEQWDEHAFKYLVQLGDIALLSDCLNCNFFDQSEECWSNFLKLKVRQEPVCDVILHHILCIECGSLQFSSLDSLPMSPGKIPDYISNPAFSLTWENFGNILIRHCGPQQAANLLQSCDIPDNALSDHFFDKLFKVGLIQEEQRSISHEVLEVIDAHLWSKRLPHFPPQIESLILQEKQHGFGNDSEAWKLKLHQLRTEFQDDTLKLAGIHWGVNTNLNRVCPCCLMPLTSAIDVAGSGILVFKCGHGFHSSCLPERVCIQCLNQKS